MDLMELAVQYRESGDKCRVRLAELEERLESQPMSNTERLRLRREIGLLTGMARDTISISNYLENYYERKDGYEGRKPTDARPGIPGASSVYQADRFF
jgi:hypothetical protein